MPMDSLLSSALISEHRIAVIQTFEQLQAALVSLNIALIEDANLPIWMQHQDRSHNTPRELAFKIITALEYHDAQEPRENIVHPGLIGASVHTIAAVEEVNSAKDEFKAAILQLKKAKFPLHDPDLIKQFERLLPPRHHNTAQALQKIGLARLHLKQCYRHIPLLATTPLKVSWTWANTRAITRISVQQAEQLLLKKGDDAGIQQQLQKLLQLSSNAPLAIVQELAPHLRANILFADGARQMIKGPLPIFYPATKNSVLPQFKAPKEKQGRDPERSLRSDVKLEATPFLPAIRAHRYLENID